MKFASAYAYARELVTQESRINTDLTIYEVEICAAVRAVFPQIPDLPIRVEKEKYIIYPPFPIFHGLKTEIGKKVALIPQLSRLRVIRWDEKTNKIKSSRLFKSVPKCRL